MAPSGAKRRLTTILAADVEGRPAEPDFAFGHKITLVIEAVLRSAAARRWVRVAELA